MREHATIPAIDFSRSPKYKTILTQTKSKPYIIPPSLSASEITGSPHILESAMTGNMHIPWTPRTVWNPETPEVRADDPNTLCERTLEILHPIIWKALKPFPEARKALSHAFRAFAKPASGGPSFAET